MAESTKLSEIARDYKSSLSDLTINSKPLITMLTMLAEENMEHAADIVNVLINYSKEAPPNVKLPVMYLIDSIIKNVGGEYKRLLNSALVNIFASAFKSMDETKRRKMHVLRQTWNEVIPPSRLYFLDVTVHTIDPAWPISNQNHHSQSAANIHINPNFKGGTNKPAQAAAYIPKKTVAADNFPKAFSTDVKSNKPSSSHHSKIPKIPSTSFNKVYLDAANRKTTPSLQPPVDNKNKIYAAQWKAKEIIPRTGLKDDKTPVQVRDPRISAKITTPTDPRLSKTLEHGIRDPRLMKKLAKSDLFGTNESLNITTSKPPIAPIQNKVIDHMKGAAFTSKSTITPRGISYAHGKKAINDSQKQPLVDSTKVNSHKHKEHHHREIRKDKVRESYKTHKSSRNEHQIKDKYTLHDNKSRKESGEKKIKKDEVPKEITKHRTITHKSPIHEATPILKQPEEDINKKLVNPTEVANPPVFVVPRPPDENKPVIQGKSVTHVKPVHKFVGKIPKISLPEQRKTKEENIVETNQVLHLQPPNVEVIKPIEPDISELKNSRSSEKQSPILIPESVSSSKIDTKQSNTVVNLFGSEDIDLRTLSIQNTKQKIQPIVPSQLPGSAESVSDEVNIIDTENVSNDKPSMEDNRRGEKQLTPMTRRLSINNPNSVSWEKFRDKDPKYKEYHRQASITDKSERGRHHHKRDDSPMEWESTNRNFRDKAVSRNETEPEERNYKLIASELKSQMKYKQISTKEYKDCMLDIWHQNENHKIQMLRQQENAPRTYRRDEPARSVARTNWRNSAHDSEDNLQQSNGSTLGFSKQYETGSVWRLGSQNNFNTQQFHEAEQSYGPEEPLDPELPGLPEDVLKSVYRNSVSHKMTIDKVAREIRSYGDKAIILLNWDDPRLISFKPTSCNVFFEEEGISLNLTTGDDYKEFYLGNYRHQIKLGVPTQELFIDGKGYQCFFGMQPTVIYLNGKHHTVGLIGTPPHVDISPEKNNSYLAGKIEMIIDARRVINLYLDAMPQKFHIDGRAFIIKFIDSLQAVTINGIHFPLIFDGLPFSITVRGYRRFIRFSALPEGIIPGKIAIQSMGSDGSPLIPFYSTNLPPLPPPQELVPFQPTTGQSSIMLNVNAAENNAVTVNVTANQINNPQPFTHFLNPNNYNHLSNIPPAPNQSEHAVQSDSVVPNAPVDISSILSTLVMSGVIKGNTNQTSMQEEQIDDEFVMEEENFAELPKTAQLWTSKTLKTRNNDLANKLFKGLQCSSCGLRFTASRAPLYPGHLDWHYRTNLKQEQSTKKANYRKFFFARSDWEVFEEIEDVDDRAPSMFEIENKTNGDNNSENEAEDIPSVMVLSDRPNLGVCPVCHETFDQYFDDETEDWRYRYAISVEESNYHPGCHTDLIKQIEKAEAAEKQKEEEKKQLEAEEARMAAEKEAEEIRQSLEKEQDEVNKSQEKEREAALEKEEEIRVAAEKERQRVLEEEKKAAVEKEKQEKERQRVLEEEKKAAAEKEKQEKRAKERLEEKQRREADRKKKEEEQNKEKLLAIEKEKLCLIEKLAKEKRKLAEKEESESKRRKLAHEAEKLSEDSNHCSESTPIISVRDDMVVERPENIASINTDTIINNQIEISNNIPDTDVNKGTLPPFASSDLMEVDDPSIYSPLTENTVHEISDPNTSADIEMHVYKPTDAIPVQMAVDSSIEQSSEAFIPLVVDNLETSNLTDVPLSQDVQTEETAAPLVPDVIEGIRIKEEPSDIAEVLPPPIPLLLADLPIKIEVDDEPDEVDDDDIAIVEQVEEPEVVAPVITNILQSSIDGNTEQCIPISEPIKNNSAGPIIRINVAKRHTDTIPEETTADEPTNSNQAKEPIEKFIPPPFTFDSSKKPLFVGANLVEQPAHSRGMEISSLCSIM